ncbi:MAG: hypothetical protein HDR88_00850 [Bacteroides sp.]|nr:hypothetical protein [Bacteroides sp.]
MRRNKLKYNLALLLVILFPIFRAEAVEPTWSIDFGSVFDNREGDEKMNKARTFFFTTLAPEIGIKFTPKDRIAGGAVWNQPLENSVKDGKIIPTLYYRHESDTWKFSMGMFPRTQLREPLPGFLWCDSLAYFQRNIRGALVQYNHEKGFFDAYIDWRQMQKHVKREAFNIVFHGEWHPKKTSFLIGAHLMMNHLAKSKTHGLYESVVDNFLVNPYIGFDFGSHSLLDSLCVKFGSLTTIERHRTHTGWSASGGGWIEACGEWKFLGLRNSLYVGKELFPLYSEFGALLYQGEAYYQSSFYDRLDLYGKIYKNKFMELEAQLNFNFAKGGFMFYQRLILDIHFGNL